jgi:hypothetical protein
MGFILAAGPAVGQSVYSEPLFELGDGTDPVIPGQADIEGAAQAGLDWGDLFGSDRGFKDVVDETGAPVANGVPDFLDGSGLLRGRRDAAFVSDAVGNVGDAAQDIGNAYAYAGFSDGFDLILYAGTERVGAGQSLLSFEFNQALFGLDENDQPVGQRTIGDLRVVADFTAGILSAISAHAWDIVDIESGTLGWLAIDILPFSQGEAAEQCNPAGTVCAVCNGSTISGGDWPSFDAQGGVVGTLISDSFLEFGINLSELLGYHTYGNYYSTRYTSVQVSTGLDHALGYFNRAAAVATASQASS